MDFIEELKWRGMLHDTTPGTQEFLQQNQGVAYVGFDPTGASLGIGNLVPIMMLVHFQRCGHKPVALVGGATGMVGDPSGKSAERNLLDLDELRHNQERFKAQLSSLLNFEDGENKAEMYNNYDWFKDFGFLDFLRDVGKHLTINYMMAKDSVKTRLETGISFTEFSYQLLQGYDFYHMHKHYGVNMQMGGSDQWGNMTTGKELIRRMGGGDSHVATCPLITKADGTKFGKTESGNIWLDGNMTSPYRFYQFWYGARDEDVVKYAKIFSLKSREELEALIKDHEENKGANILQKDLGKEMTSRLHGEEAYNTAIKATGLLFGKSTKEDFKAVDSQLIREVFEGVPSANMAKTTVEAGVPILDFLVEAGVCSSKGEARRLMKGGGIKLNKQQVKEVEKSVDATDVINNDFIVVQRGKKNYHIVYVN